MKDDLRRHVAKALVERAPTIAADAAEMFPLAEGDTLDRGYAARLGGVLVRLLSSAIHDGGVDPGGDLIASLRAGVLERGIAVEQLFAYAYVVERTALDELALDAAVGATTESWPLLAQLVRRASFEYLALLVGRSRFESTSADITDTLTTLHARAVFDAALLKEAERCGRCGYALGLILFDVDRLTAINERHGYPVGNRILERIGILLRRFFRQHDWVARYGDDEIAVLLTAGDAEHAFELAEQACVAVAERLSFTDHRTDASVPVTMTAAVVNVPPSAGTAIDPERLLIEAEAALRRAKRAGGNRVEQASGAAATRALLRNSPSV